MTDKEAKKIYNSKLWKNKRISILSRDRWECQDCLKRVKAGEQLPGYDSKIHRAVTVHHIKELKDYPELALNDENLISLCAKCHNIRHGREPQKFNVPKKRITDEMW